MKRALVTTAIILVLGAIGSMMNRRASSAQAQGPPGGISVNVAGPLPLPINVANTPTVGLASGASVTISNPGASPVLVRDVDAASTPVQQQGSPVLAPFDADETFAAYTVPTTKRLIIEYASLFCSSPPGQIMVGSIQTTAGGVVAQHVMAASLGSAGFTAAGQLVRLQADPSTVVSFRIERSDGSGFARCRASFSGVLVSP